MSEMSQAQAPAGGDPLDLTPDSPASEGDVLPGADDVDAAEESGDGGGVVSDPSPEGGGATLDPPDTEVADEDPGTSSLESGADPMPDIAGTTPENP